MLEYEILSPECHHYQASAQLLPTFPSESWYFSLSVVSDFLTAVYMLFCLFAILSANNLEYNSFLRLLTFFIVVVI